MQQKFDSDLVIFLRITNVVALVSLGRGLIAYIERSAHDGRTPNTIQASFGKLVFCQFILNQLQCCAHCLSVFVCLCVSMYLT